MRRSSHNRLKVAAPERMKAPFRKLFSALAKLRRQKAAPSWPIKLLSISIIILIAGIILGTTILVLNLRDRALAHAERTLTDIALILSTNVQHEFETLESIEKYIAKRMATTATNRAEWHVGPIDGRELHQLLKEQILAFPHIETLDLIDRKGLLISSSRSWPPLTANVLASDYFQALRSDPALPFYLSKPIRISRREHGEFISRAGLAHRVASSPA